MSAIDLTKKVVIVGAGPAGVRAAQVLVQAGLRPTVVSESATSGGQIYRQPHPTRDRGARAVYGFEWKKARALHQCWDEVVASVDYRPDTLAWNCYRGVLDLRSTADGYSQVSFDRLILATGAMDRVIPLPGWDQAGVYTLGAAQIELKAQACLLGRRPIFVGTGPLLYLVAYQYAKAGADVAAVLDVSSVTAKVQAAWGMLARPGVASKGAWYLAWLATRGVPVFHGAIPCSIEGGVGQKTLHWVHRGLHRQTNADIVCLGYGLRAETQLADLAGCEFFYSDIDRQWLPRHTEAGRTSEPAVYLAGDGAELLGAEAAELAGESAARAVLQDLGAQDQQASLDALARALDRQRRFRRGLETAFPWPARFAIQCANDTVVCRCEQVSAGQIRQAVKDYGMNDVNQVKAWTRCGMGRCQSRVCGLAAAEIVADAAGHAHVAQAGRIRAQPPVKPIPFDGMQDKTTAGKS